jgi:hypothetical protein
MAKTAITEVSTNNTFQVWLDKTNELVDLFKTDAVTASLASSAGDTTIGNVTLQGIFTANNIIAQDLLRVDQISPKSGSTSIQVDSPVNIVTNQTVLERLSSSLGPRLSLSNTTDTDWQIGFENNTTKNFVISNGSNVFRLSGSGDLELTGVLLGTAQTANTVGLIETNTTDATHFPLFANTATGNAQVRSDIGFSYNPSTGTLTTNTFAGNLTGNINGNLFGDVFASNGTTKVLENGNGSTTPAVFTGNVTGNLAGNANTATTLQTARSINGTNFNGSANITTANWGTSRNIKIGGTTKSVNGSTDITWTLGEIGAQPTLGFIPVQQGGGTSQGTNKVYIGWDGSGLRAQVDSTDLGRISFNVNVMGTIAAQATGDIGTYAMMRDVTWNGGVRQPGSLVEGTNLRYMGAAGLERGFDSFGNQITMIPGGDADGTWRLMGYLQNDRGNYGHTSSIYMRVS